VVSEDIVENTWRRVAAMRPNEAVRALDRVARQQPALLAYVMATTSDEREEVQELAIYLYHVIWQMFETMAAPGRIGKIRIERVEHHRDRIEKLLDGLAVAHQRIAERIAAVESASQPHVLRYIADALYEYEEEEDSLQLDEQESGLVFLTLKTVVDVLDEACTCATASADRVYLN
jgi:hypothetical protein